MQKNPLFRKGIVFAVIALLIVVIVAPIVSGNIIKPIRGVENLWEPLENMRYPPRPKDNVRIRKHAFESIGQENFNTEKRGFSFSNWTFYSTDDVSINKMYPNNNYGSLNRMYVSAENFYWDQDTLIKFNISSVPQGPRVVATLYLYLNKEGGSAGREYNVYRITNDWDEMSVTWNTQPSRVSSPSVTAKVPSSAGIWMDFDVTDDVQDFIDGVADNYGWLISDDDFEDFINSEFLTKENGNFIPYLDIREPETVYVNDDNTAGPWLGTIEYPFQYIQDAVDSVHHGDNIYVFNGTYNENVRINKRIALIGENKESTIILGEGIEDVIHVSNFGVNISGFTIQGGENGWYYAGIRIETDYCNIFDNILKNNEVGINLWHFSKHNKVFNNTVNHNNYQGIYANLGGHNVIINNTVDNEYIGINIRGSYYIVGGYNVVSGNIVSNNTYGILLDETRNNEVRDNTVTYNYYGIDIIDMCIKNNVSGNIVSNNEVGIILYQAGMEYEPQPNIIVGNIITDNYCGLWVEKTRDSEAYKNTISSNFYGIYVFWAEYNEIYENNITNNKGNTLRGGGITVADASYNNIQRNNFFNNTPQARFSFGILFNIYWREIAVMGTDWTGNYWGEPRSQPYPIYGKIGLWFAPFPWVNFDWHPAQEPYEIENV